MFGPPLCSITRQWKGCKVSIKKALRNTCMAPWQYPSSGSSKHLVCLATPACEEGCLYEEGFVKPIRLCSCVTILHRLLLQSTAEVRLQSVLVMSHRLAETHNDGSPLHFRVHTLRLKWIIYLLRDIICCDFQTIFSEQILYT